MKKIAKKIFVLGLVCIMMMNFLAGCGKKYKSNITDDPVEFAANLKMGWNLGNTLDAIAANDLSSETSWGQPLVTKEQIDYIKEAGFTAIRIPVSWSNHVGVGYVIDEEWMDRVNEVVDYAWDAGLYVIINSHHDCEMYYPTDEKYEFASMYIEKIWSQIAERFADYDERLIFESMNEPRLKGTSKEWWFMPNDKDGLESIRVIQDLNQLFVDTVRSSGGYNKTRYLMVPSNAASAGNALSSAFRMPEDKAGRLIVSIHAYTPYDFAMNGNGYSDWDEAKKTELSFMDDLDQKFIQNGYGVVIGEFGATNKDNLDDRIRWADDFTKKAASLGISCFWWDNGCTEVGEENFGMIDRENLSVYYPEILKVMLDNYN